MVTSEMKINLESISGDIQSSFLHTDLESSRSRIGKVKEWVIQKKSEVRPWQDFLNARKFSKPSNIADVSKRLMLNLKLYQANYILISIALVIYCIITSPLLLFGLTLACGGCYYISSRGQGQAIRMLGRDFSVVEQYILVLIISLPVFFLASAGSTVFWIIGASIVIVGLHASFMTVGVLPVDHDIEMDGVEVK